MSGSTVVATFGRDLSVLSLRCCCFEAVEILEAAAAVDTFKDVNKTSGPAYTRLQKNKQKWRVNIKF